VPPASLFRSFVKNVFPACLLSSAPLPSSIPLLPKRCAVSFHVPVSALPPEKVPDIFPEQKRKYSCVSPFLKGSAPGLSYNIPSASYIGQAAVLPPPRKSSPSYNQ